MKTSWSRVVGLSLATVPLVLLNACGDVSGGQVTAEGSVFDVEVQKAPASPWESTGLPYGGRENNGNLLRLSYRGHSVVLATTDPEWTKKAVLDEDGDPPMLELATAGATSESAIFQLTPPGDESQLWELTADGRWQQIPTKPGITKLALADVNGHLVAWAQGMEKYGFEGENPQVVAYDTELGEIVGTLDATKVEGNVMHVMAVDGGSVVLQALQDSESGKWARNYAWEPATGEVTEIPGAGREDEVTVTDYDEQSGRAVFLSFGESSRIVGPDGSIDIGDYGFGLFNSDATLVVGQGFGTAKLVDTRTNRPVELDVLLNDGDRFFPSSFAWTADDQLAVIGGMGNGTQEAWLCTPQTGVCEELGADYLGFVENSARGQFVYHDETPS